MHNVTRAPENAKLSINGEARESSSNKFTLGKVYDIELKEPTTEEEQVIISLKTDTESLTDNVTNLIDGYNNFLKTVNSYSNNQVNLNRLATDFKSLADKYNTSLESIRVSFTDEGILELDTETLTQAARAAPDPEVTFGYLRSFSDSMLEVVNSIALNPMAYTDRTVVAYKNPGHNFLNPYNLSDYSGMMFNGYC